MVAHAFSPSPLKAEAGELLSVQNWPIYAVFQETWSYIVRPCLKKKKKKEYSRRFLHSPDQRLKRGASHACFGVYV